MCSEYRLDFLPLINKCIYNKGSLKQTCLNLAVTDSNNVKPLPPVRESALTPQDREHLKLLIPNEDEVDIDILIIFQKCASIDVDGFLLGSKSGRHKSTSIVFICHHSSEDLKLGITLLKLHICQAQKIQLNLGLHMP